jgi:L-ascorbate metabolism protein UlaG (beta-lactamase superfamily)
MKRNLFRIFKLTAGITQTTVTLLILLTLFYMRQSKFGKTPSRKRLEVMKKSPNFENGRFKNLNHTPQLTEGHTILGVTYEFLFKKTPRRIPVDTIPSVRTDLLNLPVHEDVLVWFGHSSYFIQIDGRRILVDPVFSGNASPVPGTNKSFKGTDRYAAADLPDIDYLIISHDHYDHVDYETLIKLKPKTGTVICGLGVGAHFEDWGYSTNTIIERDWNEKIELDSGFVVYTTPARHFSGRGFSKNNTLWMSYVLQSPTLKIYIGGDSGYDTHYADIGNKFGPIDLAILDNGQYDVKWRYIHTLPEEVLQASHDLKAKRLFPVHSSKFAMANHPWDEPLIKITELNKSFNIPLVTPVIGEIVYLKDDNQRFKKWWAELR